MDDITMYDLFQILLFWYMLIIAWVVLGLSVLFFIIALRKKSQKLMSVSVILMTPNILLLIIQEIEPVIMLLFIIWFAVQILMFIKILREKRYLK
ncbi:hypothetical protein SAMN05443252_103102 [Bacillus sp. OV322]|uniref:hypothetical protein n=1 Tax=Bacillus sp. OV322 TaxID=1882764 RepID=UPI0008F259C4|nr:hypothetical protein [Bacillus sp. OV322]SFC37212.1 hypothetical protein SAMN05443252_103102 [Bacillus sp. OV322]